MPTYEYQAAEPEAGCDYCRPGFDVQQAMRARPLRTCPKCRQPVARKVSCVRIGTRPSTKSMLSDKNLKEKGFTKLVNEGGGKFRRVT